MRLFWLLPLVVGGSLAVLATSPAAACSCVATSAQEKLEQSEMAFVGRVVRSEFLGVHQAKGVQARVTLEPLHVLRGEPGAEVQLETSKGCCFCAVWFEIGQLYVVFARRDGDQIFTTTCMGSGPLRDAAATLEELGLEDVVARFARAWPPFEGEPVDPP